MKGEISRFQYDLLAAIRRNDTRIGADIQEILESHGYDCVHNGRLYRNLTELEDDGLVDIDPINDRSNYYTLTDDGVEALENRLEGLEAIQNSGDTTGGAA